MCTNITRYSTTFRSFVVIVYIFLATITSSYLHAQSLTFHHPQGDSLLDDDDIDDDVFENDYNVNGIISTNTSSFVDDDILLSSVSASFISFFSLSFNSTLCLYIKISRQNEASKFNNTYNMGESP